MSNKRTLLSLAVAAGLGAISLQANAAAPTVYGDLSFAVLYTGASTDGGNSSYSITDNVSLLGVKGDAAKIGSTTYYYDFNFILDGGKPNTHLAVVGAKGAMGDLSIGTRVNGLFAGMVDGSTYVTNWFYTPGMSSLQVNNGITYQGKSGSFSYGVQAFDFAKSSSNGKTSSNYTLAGSYVTGGITIGLGYTSYSDYADSNHYGKSSDTNQFGDAQNIFSGVTLKSKTGVSVGYSAGKFGVVAAYDIRKPADAAGTYSSSGTYTGYAAQDTSTIKTAMLTGTYAVSGKTTLAANISNTSQSGGVKGTIITAMVSYAPSDALLYTLELQDSNKDANANSLTGTTSAGGTKSNIGIAAGVIYNF